MRIKKHIAFREDESVELVSYLKNNNIPYDKGAIISALDIFDDDPYWPNINEFVENKKLICLSETIFSKNELSAAQWLTVRSQWRNGYPQPENAFAYTHITYSDQAHCTECGAGLVQVNPFRIKKAPKWGNRHFMMLNWIDDELFVDASVKTVFCNNCVSGITFKEVHSKKGEMAFPEIQQMVITDILPPGIRLNGQSIDEVFICAKCGTPKYHPTGIGMHSFQREIFMNAPDIVRSNEVFGWGHGADRLILINQKVYQLITQNKLDRGLVFAPVLLV